jgi:DNA polymerase (family 10)
MSRSNPEIARVFERIATALELDGANPFRIRAYREAARLIESTPEPMSALAADEGRLEEIRGIGKDLAGKIRDVVKTGTTQLFEELQEKYPAEVLDLTQIQGLGPKRVKLLFDELGIRSRADLERAARAGKVRELPRFGETVEQNILKALASAAAMPDIGRVLLAGAWQAAHEIAARIRKVPGVEQVEIAGSFRRRRETLGDLDVLACGGETDAVMSAFTTHGDVAAVLGRGDTKSSVRLANGLQVDLRLVPPESFGAALLYFTGSKAHNIELRKIAIDKGWSLSEYGLTKGDRVIAARTEEEVYARLGLAWIPPEMREAIGEIELARTGKLPRLIEEGDLKADLHMHTDRTDGREPLEVMVRAARDRGYEYVAITEHSKSLAMTFGFDGARVRKSVAEIERVRKQVPGIHVLHGLEVDILADGALDLDDESLALLDWVLVAIHGHVDQPAAVATERVLRAISHPLVHGMAHPTARKIGRREPLPFDLEKVFACAAELGVAMEINGQPDRIDLSDVHARLARDLGVRFLIDTDAHSIPQLDFVRYGVFAARRAWLTKSDVQNALPFARFEQWRTGRRTGLKPAMRVGKRKAAALAPARSAAAVRPKVGTKKRGSRATGR